MTEPAKLTLGMLKELVAQHAPVLFMHPRDAFMPCSVEWFMDHSELWLLGEELDGSSDRQLLGQGEVTGIGIAASESQHGGPALQLRLHPSAKQGPPIEEICKTPLYANAKWVVRKDGSAEAIEIQYLTFYAHNGWYDIGYLGLLKVGAHDGDWEHLTVRISPTGALQGVYCNAHRSRDGCWVDASQVERTVEGRLKIYVARHGHGTYPKGGVWWRAGLMANDLTSHKGAVWKAETVFLLPQLRPTAEACQEAATDNAAEALPELATKLEQVSEHNRPVQTSREQRDSESEEVAVMQQFICGDSSASPRQQQMRRESISPGTRGGTALKDDEEVVMMKAPSRGSKLPLYSASKQTFSGEGIQVFQHSGEWLSFLGQWGTTPSPAAQAWFWAAEPPVSRGTLLRILGHPWPETKSL